MIREFFYLQKSDRKVILTLLCVIALALGIIFLTGGEQEETNALTPADTMVRQQRNAFRPSRDSFHRRPYVRTRIVYRDRPSAINHRINREKLTSESYDSVPRQYPVKIKEYEHIVLNTADTTMLQRVPGIGPYFARKIVQYGERLGGFVSVEQLDEIDDFPLDSKRYMVVEDAHPRKLNVNKLSLNELKRHPYINFYQAKAITDYRRLHGPLKSLSDLSLLKDFPQEVIERLEPYVEY